MALIVAVSFSPETPANQESFYTEQFIEQRRELTPREYLRYLTTKEEFAILDKIIICESNWNPEAKNVNSTASGLLQFLESTWNNWGEDDVFNPYSNIIAGVKLYRAQGTKPWESSRQCWSV